MTSVAPLLTLRRMFAVLVLFSTTRFVWNGWVDTQVLDPIWTFPFDGFEWLHAPAPLSVGSFPWDDSRWLDAVGWQDGQN